jgi:hypothetical protein
MENSRRTGAAFIITGAVLLCLGLGVLLYHVGKSHPKNPVAPAPATTASTGIGNSPMPLPTWSPTKPAVAAGVSMSWAYLENAEGGRRAGGDSDPRQIDDLLVPAAAQEYLESGQPVPSPAGSRLTDALHGDTASIAWLYEQREGRDQIARRIADKCQLGSIKTGPARMDATTAARYAACLREGAIANPDRASWVIEQMRDNGGGIGVVRGSDKRQKVAQINSTVRDGDRVRTSCLAIGAYWSAAVLLDYPADRGDAYGVDVCEDTARSAFPPDMQQVPDSLAPAPTKAG